MDERTIWLVILTTVVGGPTAALLVGALGVPAREEAYRAGYDQGSADMRQHLDAQHAQARETWRWEREASLASMQQTLDALRQAWEEVQRGEAALDPEALAEIGVAVPAGNGKVQGVAT